VGYTVIFYACKYATKALPRINRPDISAAVTTFFSSKAYNTLKGELDGDDRTLAQQATSTARSVYFALLRGFELPLTHAADYIVSGCSYASSHFFVPLHMSVLLMIVTGVPSPVSVTPVKEYADEDDVDGENLFTTSFTSFSNYDLYLRRPRTEEFSSLSLYSFSEKYDKKTKTKKWEPSENAFDLEPPHDSLFIVRRSREDLTCVLLNGIALPNIFKLECTPHEFHRLTGMHRTTPLDGGVDSDEDDGELSVDSRDGEAEEDNYKDAFDDMNPDQIEVNVNRSIFSDKRETFGCFLTVLLVPHRLSLRAARDDNHSWWDTFLLSVPDPSVPNQDDQAALLLGPREIEVMHSLTTLNVDPSVSKRRNKDLATREKEAESDLAAHKDEGSGFYKADSLFSADEFLDDEPSQKRKKTKDGPKMDDTDSEFLYKRYGELLRDVEGVVKERVGFFDSIMGKLALGGTPYKYSQTAVHTTLTPASALQLCTSASVPTNSELEPLIRPLLEPTPTSLLDGHDLELDASAVSKDEPVTKKNTPLLENCTMADTIEKYELNENQAKAFRLMVSSTLYANEKDPLYVLIPPYTHLILTGIGGSGKSECVKAIIEYNEKQTGFVKTVVKMAELGSVAALLGGFTLCRLFGSRFEGTKPALHREEALLRALDLGILDEVSMVKRSSWHYFNMALQAAKKLASKQLPLVSLLLLGDCFQLAPVGSYSMFRDGYVHSATGLKTNWARDWFKRIPNCIVLEKNYRAGDDERRLRDFLHAARYGCFTVRHARWMESRVFTRETAATLDDIPTFICSTNRERSSIADAVLQCKIASRKVKVYKWVCPPLHNPSGIDEDLLRAYDALCVSQRDGPKSKIKAAPIFHAFVGMRVVLTANVATEIGVANGSSGVIRALHFPQGTEFNRNEKGVYVSSNPPVYADVELSFEPSRAPPGYGSKTYRKVRPVPLVLQEHTIDYFNAEGARFSRRCKYMGLPVLNGYASTCHSAQGRTINHPICISRGLLERTDAMQLYVASSRVTKEGHIFFEKPLGVHELNQFVMPTWVTKEWKRLNVLSAATLARFFPGEPNDEPDNVDFSDLDDVSDLVPSGAEGHHYQNSRKRKGPRNVPTPPAASKRVKQDDANASNDSDGNDDFDDDETFQPTSAPPTTELLLTTVLCEIDGVEVTVESRKRLLPGKWLCSELTSFFFKYICRLLPSTLCYAVDSLQVAAIMEKRCDRSRRRARWLQKMLAARFWILPVSINSSTPANTNTWTCPPDHWTFTAYDSAANVVYVFDSLGLHTQNARRTFFSSFVPDCIREAANAGAVPEVRVLGNEHYQRDTHSCGVFTIYVCLLFANFLSQPGEEHQDFGTYFSDNFPTFLPFNATDKRLILTDVINDPQRLTRPLSSFLPIAEPVPLVNTGNDCWLNTTVASLRALRLTSTTLRATFPLFSKSTIRATDVSDFRKSLWVHRAAISTDWLVETEQFEATALVAFFINQFFPLKFAVSQTFTTNCEACHVETHHTTTNSITWVQSQTELFPLPRLPDLVCPLCTHVQASEAGVTGLNHATFPSEFLYVECFRVSLAGRVSRHPVMYPAEFVDSVGQAYELACVGVHESKLNANRGHWFTLVKQQEDWFSASDSDIKKVTTNYALTRHTHAGFLIYRRV
jgi:hypothetical protein